MDQLNKKIEELGGAFEQFKKANDERLAQVEKKGSADPILLEKAEKANADISRLENEIKAMQTAMNRSGSAAGESQEKKADKERKDAFRKFLAKGADRMSEAELKAMSVGTDSDGGYVVHPEFQDGVEGKLIEVSPMRELANVQQISGMKLVISLDMKGANAGWVSETAARTATNTPQLNTVEIAAEEIYANPQATQAFLEDSAINAEAWLQGAVAEKFGEVEGTAFITGDGTGKPKGILGYAAGTAYNQVQQVITGSAAAIASGDAVIDLIHSLKAAYRKNGKFLLNDKTLKTLRKLKTTDGQYLWQPGLQAGQVSTLLGYEYREAPDMPVEAANALVMAFGDFKKAYTIVDRVGISVLRDPFTNKPFVGFYTRKRVGGGVVVSEAIKLLKCSAT
jgi:HK97 family phage major capsid protein